MRCSFSYASECSETLSSQDIVFICLMGTHSKDEVSHLHLHEVKFEVGVQSRVSILDIA